MGFRILTFSRVASFLPGVCNVQTLSCCYWCWTGRCFLDTRTPNLENLEPKSWHLKSQASQLSSPKPETLKPQPLTSRPLNLATPQFSNYTATKLDSESEYKLPQTSARQLSRLDAVVQHTLRNIGLRISVPLRRPGRNTSPEQTVRPPRAGLQNFVQD